jgi:hypothetical protein
MNPRSENQGARIQQIHHGEKIIREREKREREGVCALLCVSMLA